MYEHLHFRGRRFRGAAGRPWSRSHIREAMAPIRRRDARVRDAWAMRGEALRPAARVARASHARVPLATRTIEQRQQTQSVEDLKKIDAPAKLVKNSQLNRARTHCA